MNGEVVVVTGASGGVGRATVREFARQGAGAVGLLARDTEGLYNAEKEVQQCGCRALAIPTDVAKADQVEAAAERIEQELGPIDVWVNDAMTTIFSPFLKIQPDEYRRATEVTYLGTVWGTMAALKRMYPRDRGTIIQVGSALAYRSIPLQSPYCGAKHAIKGFTDSIRSELIHDRKSIHITMVQLPAMNTPQFTWGRTRLPRHPQPVPPIFEPEVAARAIVWSVHHPRREVAVGWPTVKAIWGNKFIPGWLDKYLATMAYAGQQTDQPVPADRPDNLFEPVPGDFGAHGIFTDRSSDFSWQWWLNSHLRWIAIGGLLSLGASVAAFLWGQGNGQAYEELPSAEAGTEEVFAAR
jgi:NAD(P)-dependent dehydrogenase (short-subunit alcohol dehydrogenase family)